MIFIVFPIILSVVVIRKVVKKARAKRAEKKKRAFERENRGDAIVVPSHSTGVATTSSNILPSYDESSKDQRVTHVGPPAYES